MTKEELTIPIYNKDGFLESLKLYFDGLKNKEFDDSDYNDVLEIELNDKLKLRFKVHGDAYVYRENGILKLGGLEQISQVYCDCFILEIIDNKEKY